MGEKDIQLKNMFSQNIGEQAKIKVLGRKEPFSGEILACFSDSVLIQTPRNQAVYIRIPMIIYCWRVNQQPKKWYLSI